MQRYICFWEFGLKLFCQVEQKFVSANWFLRQCSGSCSHKYDGVLSYINGVLKFSCTIFF